MLQLNKNRLLYYRLWCLALGLLIYSDVKTVLADDTCESSKPKALAKENIDSLGPTPKTMVSPKSFEPSSVMARKHHIKFSKVIIPNLALAYPARFFKHFSAFDNKTYLTNAWNNIAAVVEPAERVEPCGLDIHTTVLDDQVIILITLPEAIAKEELYYVAIIANKTDMNNPRVYGLEYRHAVVQGQGKASTIVELGKHGQSIKAATTDISESHFVTRVRQLFAKDDNNS